MALESFDDTALGEVPPTKGGRSLSTKADPLPKAVGTPALSVRADGTDNLRANAATRGPMVKAQPKSAPRGTRAAVQSYTDDEV